MAFGDQTTTSTPQNPADLGGMPPLPVDPGMGAGAPTTLSAPPNPYNPGGMYGVLGPSYSMPGGAAGPGQGAGSLTGGSGRMGSGGYAFYPTRGYGPASDTIGPLAQAMMSQAETTMGTGSGMDPFAARAPWMAAQSQAATQGVQYAGQQQEFQLAQQRQQQEARQQLLAVLPGLLRFLQSWATGGGGGGAGPGPATNLMQQRLNQQEMDTQKARAGAGMGGGSDTLLQTNILPRIEQQFAPALQDAAIHDWMAQQQIGLRQFEDAMAALNNLSRMI